MRIFIGNLAFSTSDNDLEALFASYGRVTNARIATDKGTGKSRGFGFVDMPDVREAADAIEDLHGSTFSGRTLTVNEAKPREARTDARLA